MATTTAPVGRGAQHALPAVRGRAGFAGTLRSELTKIRSVRSTYWSLIAMAVVTIGLGALFCFGKAQSFSHLPPGAQAHAAANSIGQSTEMSLFGLILGQLIIAVLGALTITAEYTTGMIRTSMTVMPRRSTWLAAKAVVFGGVAMVTGMVTAFASYFIGQAILSSQHINSTIGQPGVLRAVVGGGLFLTACGLLSFGLGAMLRHSAGAIAASIGVLFVAYVLGQFLPADWADHVDKWIPFNAGAAIWENVSAPNMLRPWTGFAVLCGYAAVVLVGGLILFLRRDA
ncbi:MAG TPA: ABC transporter permease subunit [Streptosporangiaceae bacterium]|nr:ABC transporter permease subunit [Streptosporangiaceae bacterium]